MIITLGAEAKLRKLELGRYKKQQIILQRFIIYFVLLQTVQDWLCHFLVCLILSSLHTYDIKTFSEPEIKTKKHTRGMKQPAAVRSIVNPSSKRYGVGGGVFGSRRY